MLITATEVIDRAFTNSNTDTALLPDIKIEIAQEEYIRPVLAGDLDADESLYQEIVDQEAGGTLTAANTTLLGYIKDCLAFYVLYVVYEDIIVNSTSLGAQVNFSDFSQPASDSQRSDAKTSILRNANTMRDKMIRFIEDDANINDYPLYKRGHNITNSTSIRGGIVMGSTQSVRIDDE